MPLESWHSLNVILAASKDPNSSTDGMTLLKALRDFSRNQDPRIRSAALGGLIDLHERGVNLDISLYSEFCESLSDDYACVRIMAMKLLQILSHLYTDCLVFVSKGDEQIRLIDDAFGRICNMICDLSMEVRRNAARLLGSFSKVSVHFLDQTLDKKLMSNLRKKKSAHERNKESYASGEWSSGKRWADDAPKEEVCKDTVNLMESGACGAFVHGLEDEFLEVRMATLQSIRDLARVFPAFAAQSLDFLVDMFNDEIEEIRLEAIQVLRDIGLESVVLRDDQIQIILPAFKDHSNEIRESLYEMLGACKVASEESLRSCVMILQENLNRHSEDRIPIWRSLQYLGRNHPHFVSSLVTELLGIHPFLELPEPSIEDPSYISLLMLIFNAASVDGGSIIPQLEKYSQRHYCYLRNAYPALIPNLPQYELDASSTPFHNKNPKDSTLGVVIPDGETTESTESPERGFICDIFTRLRNSIEHDTIDNQTRVIQLSISDLQRLGQVESSMKFACEFLILYLNCQLSIRKILMNSNWINALLLSPLQSSVFRSSLEQILVTTFHLSRKFHGIHPIQSALINQTRVKALALQLMAIIHGSNASALALCDAFLEELSGLKKNLENSNLKPDALTESMIAEIHQLEEPKPGSVARVLQPLFLSSQSGQFADLSLMVCEATIDSLLKMTVSNATILEPLTRSDHEIKFTAGLVLAVKFHAIICNIKDPRMVRVKIKFPDSRVHLFIPKLSDLKEIHQDSPFAQALNNSTPRNNFSSTHQNNSTSSKATSSKSPTSNDSTNSPANGDSVKSYRMLTNVYLSHGIWTDSCQVELGLVLDFRGTSTSLSVSQVWAAKTGSYNKSSNNSVTTQTSKTGDDNMLIDLCEPIRITVLPRAAKRAIM